MGGANVGYNSGADSFAVQNNWFSNGDGGFAAYFFGAVTNLTMTGNDFVRDISGVISPSSYPSNNYHHAVRPSGTFVFVRPNAYESGRANIVILSWDLLATVNVDVSGVLAPRESLRDPERPGLLRTSGAQRRLRGRDARAAHDGADGRVSDRWKDALANGSRVRRVRC